MRKFIIRFIDITVKKEYTYTYENGALMRAAERIVYYEHPEDGGDIVKLRVPCATWVKIGYDIIGAGLKWYAKRKGYTLFFDKLLYGIVPKIRGIFGKFLTLIRKAIWRLAGNISSNFTTSFIGYALNKFVNFINILRKREYLNKVVNIIFRCLTLGSLIALILDWATDGDAFNNKIRL